MKNKNHVQGGDHLKKYFEDNFDDFESHVSIEDVIRAFDEFKEEHKYTKGQPVCVVMSTDGYTKLKMDLAFKGIIFTRVFKSFNTREGIVFLDKGSDFVKEFLFICCPPYYREKNYVFRGGKKIKSLVIERPDRHGYTYLDARIEDKLS